MTSSFSDFAARVRDFIRACSIAMAERRQIVAGAGGRDSISEYEPPHACPASAVVGSYKHEFDALARELFALQFKHVAPYRRLCEARRKTPESVAHWSDIPAVPTSAFKELEFSSLEVDQRAVVFHSSGTTEQRPSRHFHCAESLAHYEESLLPWWRTHLMADDEAKLKLVILTPPPESAPHSSLAHMLGAVRREFGTDDSLFTGGIGTDGGWTVDIEETIATLEQTGDQPLIVMGTAFSFVHLLDHLAEKNRRVCLPAGSRVMETGGYKGRSRALPKTELHRLISGRLGVPSSHIVCEYGMSELSSQAYDGSVWNAERGGGQRFQPVRVSQDRQDACPTSRFMGRVFHFPPWARAQIISPETGRAVSEGETGLIRVFDLANVWSVMAIQTEDLGVRRGDGFELLGRATQAEARGCSLMTA